MYIFLESINKEEIQTLSADRFIEGVVINSAQIASSGEIDANYIKDIGELVGGPVLVDVMADQYDAILQNTDSLTSLAETICVSVPMGFDGIRACRDIKSKHHKTNMTLCFSLYQAILAAKANADFVSIDIDILNKNKQDAFAFIKNIRKIYDANDFKTQILAVSLHSVEDTKQAILHGADCISLSAELIQKLTSHNLTDACLKKAKKDWQKINFLDN